MHCLKVRPSVSQLSVVNSRFLVSSCTLGAYNHVTLKSNRGNFTQYGFTTNLGLGGFYLLS